MKPKFELENGIPYIDNAVTTSISENVRMAMLPFLEESFADPNEDQSYEPGASAAEVLYSFREKIADMVGAEPENVWFTSGGTEANNWILKCIKRPGLPVCSAVEHLSVLLNCETHIDVDSDGLLDMKQLGELLASGDISVLSIQHANQETGVIQDIPAIAELCDYAGVPLHVDASMSFGVITVDLFDLGANFLTLSSHKAWGPLGAGVLVSDGKYEVKPWMVGGNQEFGMRAGAVNMPAIAGFVAAAEELRIARTEWKAVEKLQKFIETELSDILEVKVQGAGASRLPNMICLTIRDDGDGINEAAFMAAELERLYGLCIGVGGAAEPGTSSRVLDAMGVSSVDREATIRFRFSHRMTRQEANMVIVGISAAIKAQKGRPLI